MALKSIGESPVAEAFGLGPGATLDLRGSPDAKTLLSSGRNLRRVDDVHMLSSYLLLKLGAIGVIWAGILAAALYRVTAGVLVGRGRLEADRKRNPWSLSLLLFVLAGVAYSLPAATNLLANPLIPLLLGTLWASGSQVGRQQTLFR